MKIQIDVDSTLYDSAELFARVAKDDFQVDLPVNSNNWSNYSDCADPGTLHRIFRRSHSQQYVPLNEPYPDAADVIQLLADKNHQIFYVSDRHPQGGPTLSNWLKARGFPVRNDSVVVGMDKRSWMNENHPEIVIDDRVRTMLYALYDIGAEAVYSLEHPWNVNLRGEIQGIYICKDWQELGRALSEYT